MLKIIIPQNFNPERFYIINLIFKEFLSITFQYEFSFKKKNYEILYLDKKIIIEDHFFNKFSETNNYINIKNIPEKIFFINSNITQNASVPIIYGRNFLEIKSSEIICGYDIFASAFFMLSRWEEIVVKHKDKHNRVLEDLLLAVKQNFYKQPIVNQYVNLLINLLQKINFPINNFWLQNTIIQTHDIDFIEKYHNSQKIIKAVVGDVVKRKSLKMCIKTINTVLKIKKGKENDPFDRFNEFMDIAEKHNRKAHFYFIAGKLGEYDVHYNISHKILKKTIQSIENRGHIVGIHGSYNSYNKGEVFQTELSRLQSITRQTITENRQHFLRFSNPQTWQILEKSGIEIDSTMGFSKFCGYRCGTGETFPVFDVINRKQLKIKEQPFVFMDASILKNFQQKELQNAAIDEFINTQLHHNGKCAVLFHNDSLIWNFAKKILT